MWSLITDAGAGGGSSWGGVPSGGSTFSFAPVATTPTYSPTPTYTAPLVITPSIAPVQYSSPTEYQSAPFVYSPNPPGSMALTVGPYGEGLYTPLDYPALRPLGRYETLGQRRRQSQGVVNSDRDLLIKLGIGIAILALLK